ncbi:MAG: zinc-binding dehydrogenase [bacterium]|nr:alcohol dehydrogenase [Gammaproteobacteria bacterium]HIL95962.1 alcohol dehydrogenase [Pseudomonadales bacterium]
MTQKAQAMALTAPGTLEPIELAIPDIDASSALLRIEACGICGTDCEQFATGMRLPMPHIPGHEPLGIIEKIGDLAAKKWQVDVGDRVAVETLLACHICKRCLAGDYHLCAQRQVYSTIPISEGHGLWGAYGNYMMLDGRSILHKMDKSIPAEIAVMYNPLGAGFRWAVEIPQTGVGEDILIMGPGQRGLAAVIAARAAGVRNIIVTGLSADANKLALAKEFGATHVVDIENEDLRSEVQNITAGEGVDVVLDVTPGATSPIGDAINNVRAGGRVVLAGVKGFKPVPEFVSDKVVFKEIKILGAFGVTSSGYRKAIELIESGRVPLEKMHTHNFAVSEAETAIRTLAREIPGEESIHSCLIPEH